MRRARSDYFGKSVPRLLESTAPGVPSLVSFFPTEKVVRIEVNPEGVAAGQCRSTACKPTVGSKNTVSATDLSSVEVTISQEERAALFVYKGIFPSAAFSKPTAATRTPAGEASGGSGGRATVPVQEYLRNRDYLNSQIAASLALRNLTSVAALQLRIKGAKQWFSDHQVRQSNNNNNQQHVDTSAAGGTSTSTSTGAAGGGGPIPVIPEAATAIIKVLPTRVDLKTPFWQPCHSERLQDVLHKVFH
jgi:hypothetical protein